MIRTLTILCLLSAPAFGIWQKGLRMKFGLNPLDIYNGASYKELPQNVTQAASDSWVNTTDLAPTAHTGYESLELWCPGNFTGITVCLLYDDTGYIAGVQIGLSQSKCINNATDWEQVGFTNWAFTSSGTSYKYWTARIYFISTTTLATSAATRLASRDDSYLLQGAYYYVTSFNGTLQSVPVSHTELASSSSSNFTSQSCILGMGQHYYYNMTTSLECSSSTIMTWFPLDYNEQCAGTGFMMPVNCTFDSDETNYYESPSNSEIKMIVPNGPDCLYNYGDDPGVITLHIYYFYDPYFITCLW